MVTELWKMKNHICLRMHCQNVSSNFLNVLLVYDVFEWQQFFLFQYFQFQWVFDFLFQFVLVRLDDVVPQPTDFVQDAAFAFQWEVDTFHPFFAFFVTVNDDPWDYTVRQTKTRQLTYCILIIFCGREREKEINKWWVSWIYSSLYLSVHILIY